MLMFSKNRRTIIFCFLCSSWSLSSFFLSSKRVPYKREGNKMRREESNLLTKNSPVQNPSFEHNFVLISLTATDHWKAPLYLVQYLYFFFLYFVFFFFLSRSNEKKREQWQVANSSKSIAQDVSLCWSFCTSVQVYPNLFY